MLLLTPKVLIEWLLKDIYKIFSLVILFGAISVFYASSIPNKYSSQAVVSSNLSDAKSMGGALSSLGGLASIAGISIGGGGLSPEVLKEMLNSSSFLAAFIKEYHLEKEIMAAVNYNPLLNEFTYDEKLYNINSNQWVRDVNFPLSLVPNNAELVSKLKESYSVSYARKTKLITLNFTSLSPFYSKENLTNLVFYFNSFMREKDIQDASLSIKYLQEQLSQENYGEVKLALQQIMEEQYKKLALAKTRDDYALRIIEQPMLADKKSGPKRAVICIIITFLGTILTVLLYWSIRIFKLR